MDSVAPVSRVRPFFRFLLAVLLGFFALILAESLAEGAVPEQHAVMNEIVGRTLGLIFLFGIFTLLLRTLDNDIRPLPLALGLPLTRGGMRRFGAGNLIGFVLITMAVACIVIFGSYRAAFAGDYPAMLAILLLVAIASLLEEVALRGYAFQKLMESIGPWPAAIALSGLFGWMHAHNPHANLFSTLNTALVGVVFSIAVIRTGDLWMAWGMHLAWNLALGTLWGLPVSGLTFFSVLVKGQAEGPDWLTGGSYGIEASAVCTVLLLAAIPVIWQGAERENASAAPMPAASNPE